VVRVSVDNFYGTGVLLYGGAAVLTAAHLFNSSTSNTSVFFETASGSTTVSTSRVVVHPAYDAREGNSDLALVWLTAPAPADAQRYSLYRSTDEVGQVVDMVGYGVPGLGSTGTVIGFTGKPVRLKATNIFDAGIETVKNALGSAVGWSPAAGTQLLADFDNGQTAQDALGRLINRPDLGTGQTEGLISRGDSGGPAFVQGKLAGIASYTSNLSSGSVRPDIDNVLNSSFGEIAAWQRVSYYQQWIDQSLRAQYTNAPKTPAEVKKTVLEGNSGTVTTYFLLQFNATRSSPNQLISVDYSTRDGTAKAGTDYLAASGTLVLYPNETQALIPIEILGDTVSEPDETFFLDVFNPLGASFGEGVVKLTAMRTILNDDAGIFA
jgi:secreted trypsin-like serine protease